MRTLDLITCSNSFRRFTQWVWGVGGDKSHKWGKERKKEREKERKERGKMSRDKKASASDFECWRKKIHLACSFGNVGLSLCSFFRMLKPKKLFSFFFFLFYFCFLSFLFSFWCALPFWRSTHAGVNTRAWKTSENVCEREIERDRERERERKIERKKEREREREREKDRKREC